MSSLDDDDDVVNNKCKVFNDNVPIVNDDVVNYFILWNKRLHYCMAQSRATPYTVYTTIV